MKSHHILFYMIKKGVRDAGYVGYTNISFMLDYTEFSTLTQKDLKKARKYWKKKGWILHENPSHLDSAFEIPFMTFRLSKIPTVVHTPTIDPYNFLERRR